MRHNHKETADNVSWKTTKQTRPPENRLTLNQLVPSADSLCKQLESRPGLMAFLKEFVEKVDYEKKSTDDKAWNTVKHV